MEERFTTIMVKYQTVPPVHPEPPHWPYSGTVGPVGVEDGAELVPVPVAEPVEEELATLVVDEG